MRAYRHSGDGCGGPPGRRAGSSTEFSRSRCACAFWRSLRRKSSRSVSSRFSSRESQPNVSRHIAPLKAAGLVLVRKQGTRALVRIAEARAARSRRRRRARQRARALRRRRQPLARSRTSSASAIASRASSSRRRRDAPSRRSPRARRTPPRPTSPRSRGSSRPQARRRRRHRRRRAPRRARAGVRARRRGRSLRGRSSNARARACAVARLRQRQAAQVRARRARSFASTSGGGADVVFASRLLHHAPRPVDLVAAARASRAVRAAAVVVIDYERHDDESMRDEADLWLGFEPAELRRFAARSRARRRRRHSSPRRVVRTRQRCTPALAGAGRRATEGSRETSHSTKKGNEAMSTNYKVADI